MGVPVITGTIETNQLPSNSFDVITFLDVFEHIPFPRQVLERVNLLLKPDGLLVLNLPDTGSWCAQILGKRWALIIPPEHLHFYFRHRGPLPADEDQGHVGDPLAGGTGNG